jgi:hypothetical protein
MYFHLVINLALFYLLGIGTSVDEEDALKWLSCAALYLEGLSLYIYVSVEQSVAEAIVRLDDLLKRFWCASSVDH